MSNESKEKKAVSWKEATFQFSSTNWKPEVSREIKKNSIHQICSINHKILRCLRGNGPR